MELEHLLNGPLAEKGSANKLVSPLDLPSLADMLNLQLSHH